MKGLMALLSFIVILTALSCESGSEKKPENDAAGTADDIVVVPDEDTVVVDEAAAEDDLVVDAVDEAPAIDETPVVDETVVPDVEGFETIGDFALDFNGQVNTDLSNYMSIKGGSGTVNFNYRGTPFSFGELTVVIVKLFPLAVLQQNNVAVMWLDKAPGLAAEVRQVFGFTFPSTIQPGEQTMEAAQAFAFYGDINVNLQAGQFSINCIRAAGYQGFINVISYAGNTVNFMANGTLLDPSAAGSRLPYPECPE